MPTPDIPHINTHNNPLLKLAAGLADEMLSNYMAWRDEAIAAADASRDWHRAPAAQEAARFAAYMVDTEEAAATRYAMVVKNLDRAL